MFSKRIYRRRNKPRQSSWLDGKGKDNDNSFFPPIQTKLNIGKPGDVYEQEADKNADKVVEATSDAPTVQKMGEEKEDVQAKGITGNITPFVQKQEDNNEEDVQAKCEECSEEESAQMKEEEPVQAKEEEEETVQTKKEEEPVQSKEDEEEAVQTKEEEEVQTKEGEEEPIQAQKEEELQQKSKGQAAPAVSVESGISSHRGGGHAMDSETMMSMEKAFSNDFSNVRIHTGSYAKDMSNQLNARAFTNGNDIYFNSGEYNPNSKKGKHLLAHELTHTIQQKGKTNLINKQAQPNPQHQCTPGSLYSRANSTLYFNQDSTDLRGDSAIHLVNLINEVNQYITASQGTGNLLIHGYASEEGAAGHNQRLSQRRAQYVKTLLSAAGISSSRMIAVGHGEDTSSPVLENNRRVQITYLPPVVCNPCRFTGVTTPLLLDTRTPAHYAGGPDFDITPNPTSISVRDAIKLAPWIRDSDATLETVMNRELTLLAGSVGSAMTTHFRGGSGSTYLHSSSSVLGALTHVSPSANAVFHNIETQMRTQFRVMQAIGNIDANLFSLASVPHLHFTFSDPLPLKAVIGGSQGHEVYITGMRSLGNSTPCAYQIDVKLVLFDDFGVDTSDLYSPSLIAFWILQHRRIGNRPFVNRLEMERTFTF